MADMTAEADGPLPEPPAMADGPSPLRWRGYPGVPLTEAPLSARAALGIAVYAIVLNLAMTLYLRSAGIAYLAHSAIYDLAQATGIGQMTVAAVVSAVLMVMGYALILAPVVVLARRRGLTFAQATGLRPAAWGPVLGIAAVAVVIALCLVVQYGVFLSRFGIQNPGNTAELVKVFGASPLGIAILFAIGAGVAPFAEEVVFRGVVFAGLREAWREPWAILVSSLLFGIVHLQPLAMLPTALIGAVLARVFSSTRSLWASILVHGAYNALVITIALAAARMVR
jgi:uncharacterized protein